MPQPRRPLAAKLWVVTVENEGLISNAFLTEREARQHVHLVQRRQPFLRVDLAQYHVIGDTWETMQATTN